ncbi:hypothetical protein PVK06_035048 [Gossypium arboreum]|uniref:Uncharacterized protein n=1 Tax=Gossypium arboreum TaxID=29729 RepID=A0ABR0NHY4_GOSAR|nr:hypothetical protein PVK06_035048 [Gossypium arboreum]
MTTEAAEIMEKLKDKRAKYEVITSSALQQNRFLAAFLAAFLVAFGLRTLQNSSVFLINTAKGSFVNPTQYSGSSSQQYMPWGSQAQAEVQRLRDQITQMQASIVEQITQLKAEATSKEAEVQRNIKNSSYNLKWRQ